MNIDLASWIKEPVTDPLWLVKDMIPRGSLVILAGEHGTGKSMLMYNMVMAIAGGLPFLGFPTVQTSVLYFDQENGRPDSKRYWQRTWRGLGCPDPDLWAPSLHFEWFTLTEQWAKQMRTLAAEHKPGVIIVDTATPALRIKDENDNAEASRSIQELCQVQQAANNDTTIIILKHEKTRDDTAHRRTVRGAKAWLGAVDIVMYLSRGRGGSGSLRPTVLEADKPRAFGLQYPLAITPHWTQPEEPMGLVFNARRAVRGQENAQQIDHLD